MRAAGGRRAMVASGHPLWLPLRHLRLPGRPAVRRATGCTISELLRDLIAGPLGIADEVHFGVPGPATVARVAIRTEPEGPSTPPPEPGSPQARAMPVIVPKAALPDPRDVLGADIPSMGTMTARAAATVYAALLGHLDAVHLGSAERLAAMAAITYQGPNSVMGVESAWAFGYRPARPAGTYPGSTFGMLGGDGASSAGRHRQRHHHVAVMRNRCSARQLHDRDLCRPPRH